MLVYDGLLSQIEQLCATQQKRPQDHDRQIIAAIEDIAASRFKKVVEGSNHLADLAHDLDEQKAATQGLGTMLIKVRDQINGTVPENDRLTGGQIVAEIEELLGRDVVSEVLEENDVMRDRLVHLEALINTPELINFVQGAVAEAAHQRNRWGPTHDAYKTMEEWVTVIVHLLAKFVNAGWNNDVDKTLHHLITLAAVAANAHAQIVKIKLQQMAAATHPPTQPPSPPSPPAAG